ncbi:MAG: histidine triad nucleotide-binding protein [Elusimicrobia bacterium]|nr:histidine triad nucleotide-binding protein [Elusimicrobiota bacterium]
MSACIFCDISEGAVQTQMVYEDDRAVVFKDRNPAAPTHLLVVPRKHIPRVAESVEDDAGLLGHLQLVAGAVAKREGIKDFRLVTNNGRGAGQSVDHLHYHLLAGRRMNWPPG